MDLFKEFAVDTKRLSEGVWHVFDAISDRIVEESEIGTEAAILIASTDNPAYTQMLEKKMKPHLLKRGVETDRKVRDKITAECLAELVILGWKNFIISGQELQYSKQNVIDIMLNPKWVRLRDRILVLIGNEEAFKAEREDEIVGNS
jgi:hypothetical protein